MFHFSFIEQVLLEDPSKLKEMLWYRKRYWKKSTVHSYPWIMEGTISINFTVKSVRDMESISLFQLLHCYCRTSRHSLSFLIIFSPVITL